MQDKVRYYIDNSISLTKGESDTKNFTRTPKKTPKIGKIPDSSEHSSSAVSDDLWSGA